MDIISTPQLLYHGTAEHAVNEFCRQLLNSRYWRPGRDFGEGLYTTTSIVQARKWARKAEKEAVSATRACVLEIELRALPARFVPQVFLGESLSWAEYIWAHRKVNRKGLDPCAKHADLIMGPMADNDTGKIVREALLLNKDVRWFYEQIIRSAGGRKLDSLRLGNQVVFTSERWETSLSLVGYYVYAEGRWIYHENSSTAQSV